MTGRRLHKDPVLDSETVIPDANRRFRSLHRGLQSIKLAQVRIRGFRARGEEFLSVSAAIRHIPDVHSTNAEITGTLESVYPVSAMTLTSTLVFLLSMPHGFLLVQAS